MRESSVISLEKTPNARVAVKQAVFSAQSNHHQIAVVTNQSANPLYVPKILPIIRT
jgi:hypothetical protein